MTQTNNRFEVVANVVLVCCALMFAAVLVKREFFDHNSQSVIESGPPKHVSNWNVLRANSVALRSPDAPVVVLEFADLECPACKAFYERLTRTIADSHANVGLLMVHYPLSIHRFARPAARAMECANAQGVGPRFVELAYAKQDSFGLKPWVSYAQESGIPDSSAFAKCAQDTVRIERIETGRQLGDSMNVRFTPTIIINGWRFSDVPNDEELRSALQALAAGKSPPGA